VITSGSLTEQFEICGSGAYFRGIWFPECGGHVMDRHRTDVVGIGLMGRARPQEGRHPPLLRRLQTVECRDKEGFVPLPGMDERIDSLGEATIFSTLD